MDRKIKRQSYKSIDGFMKPIVPNKVQTKDETVVRVKSTRRAELVHVPIHTVTPKVRRSFKKNILLGFTAIFIIGLGFGTWYGARVLGNVNKVFHGNVFSDVHALVSQIKLKGEDRGRINILLAGNSADDLNHGGAELTDTIMVVSIDPVTHSGFVLSIPRDLWVNIPNWSHQKINAANDVTKFSVPGLPAGGMGQLQQIVQDNLGIPIDYYALINYAAFRDVVNAVGGIAVNIQSPDPRGLYDPNIAKADGGPLLLPNGDNILDGRTALNLARARGDPCGCGKYEYGFPQSDFNRTQHQREMLTAIAVKAKSIGVIANPLKISSLFSSFGNNISTDLNIQSVFRFAQLTKDMDVTNLKPLSFTTAGERPLLTNYTAPDGEQALVPKAGIDNFGAIQQYYRQITSNDPIIKEAPTAVVLNATNVSGLAHREALLLQAKGFNVIGTADASSRSTQSSVFVSPGVSKPAATQYLRTKFQSVSSPDTSSATTQQAYEASQYTADFVIILGQDRSLSTAP